MKPESVSRFDSMSEDEHATMSTTTKEQFIERQIARGMTRDSAERGAELLLRLKASPSDIHDAQARNLAEKMLKERGIS